jgi:hypothetical protein
MIRRLAIIIATLTPDPAFAACHKFSVWHYPWVQRCPVRVAALSPLPPVKETGFILPELTPITGDEPSDEVTRARLLLHGYLDK